MLCWYDCTNVCGLKALETEEANPREATDKNVHAQIHVHSCKDTQEHTNTL